MTYQELDALVRAIITQEMERCMGIINEFNANPHGSSPTYRITSANTVIIAEFTWRAYHFKANPSTVIENGMLDRLTVLRDSLVEDLEYNNYRHNSTCPLFNAVQEYQREAVGRLLRQVRRYVDTLERALLASEFEQETLLEQEG